MRVTKARLAGTPTESVKQEQKLFEEARTKLTRRYGDICPRLFKVASVNGLINALEDLHEELPGPYQGTCRQCLGRQPSVKRDLDQLRTEYAAITATRKPRIVDTIQGHTILEEIDFQPGGHRTLVAPSSLVASTLSFDRR